MPKRHLGSEQRRALTVLAEAEPDGCTRLALRMNGFRMHLLNGLVSDGLATMQETARAGGTKVVTRFRITDAGRRVLGIPTD